MRRRGDLAVNPPCSHLAVTANAMPHRLATYLAGGMDGHIAKPIQAHRLFEVLQQALDANDELRAVA